MILISQFIKWGLLISAVILIATVRYIGWHMTEGEIMATYWWCFVLAMVNVVAGVWFDTKVKELKTDESAVNSIENKKSGGK